MFYHKITVNYVVSVPTYVIFVCISDMYTSFRDNFMYVQVFISLLEWYMHIHTTTTYCIGTPWCRSNYELTNDTSYHVIKDELWSLLCPCFLCLIPCHKGVLLYSISCTHFGNKSIPVLRCTQTNVIDCTKAGVLISGSVIMIKVVRLSFLSVHAVVYWLFIDYVHQAVVCHHRCYCKRLVEVIVTLMSRLGFAENHGRWLNFWALCL